MVIAASQRGLAWSARLPQAPTSAPNFSSNARQNASFCRINTGAMQCPTACSPMPLIPRSNPQRVAPDQARALLGMQVVRASKS